MMTTAGAPVPATMMCIAWPPTSIRRPGTCLMRDQRVKYQYSGSSVPIALYVTSCSLLFVA